jgi:type VI protein secretion system component Hcp
MIDIHSFNFRCGVAGSESAAPEPPPPAARQTPRPGGRPHDSAAEAGTTKARPAPAGPAAGPFQSWRAGKSVRYPLDVQPITFERLIDVSSTTLIQNCIDCISYDSATVIKRKPAGGELAGEVYLRMDFNGVLVTGVEWSDGDYVKETCTFICRSITVSYRAQLPHGGLGPVVSGFWSMVPHERQVNL